MRQQQVTAYDLLVTAEWIAAVHEHIEKNAHRPDVQLRAIVWLAAKHLWRTVVESADELAELDAATIVGGRAEVDEFAVEVFVDNHVLVFNVAVHDVAQVQVGNC